MGWCRDEAGAAGDGDGGDQVVPEPDVLDDGFVGGVVAVVVEGAFAEEVAGEVVGEDAVIGGWLAIRHNQFPVSYYSDH